MGLESKKGIKLSLKATGKEYQFNIPDDDNSEELYRLAENNVNKLVATFESPKYRQKDINDCLAITAFTTEISRLKQQVQSNNAKNDVVLDTLSKRIEDFLNRK